VASAMTCASCSVATVSPTAPWRICSAPLSGGLCVFVCGRHASPCADVEAAILDRFASMTSRSTAAAGVITPARVSGIRSTLRSIRGIDCAHGADNLGAARARSQRLDPPRTRGVAFRMDRNFLVGMLVALALLVAGVVIWIRRRRAGSALYHERLLEAVADGVITQEELAELEALRRRHDVSAAQARMAALVAYRRVLADALEDAELTPEEDRTLAHIQERLGIDERELRADKTQLCRVRLLTRITN